MPFPGVPSLLASNQVICIRHTWGIGPGGLRRITRSVNIGQFFAIVEPEMSKSLRGEGSPEGYDAQIERFGNYNHWAVIFHLPNIPPGGLKPGDTILWDDFAGVAHILNVIAYWPHGNDAGDYVARTIERS